MKHIFNVLFIAAMSMMLASCAMQKKGSMFSPVDMNANYKTGGFVKKADNFLLIFDSSSSMFENYNHRKKLDLAKETADHLNQTIPDINLQAGLRVFGPYIKPYGMTGYTEEGMKTALSKITNATGFSPLYGAIDAGAEQLSASPGRIAAIIISDGADMDDRPVRSAKKIKERYGDRLCIYTIQIGDLKAGKQILSQITDAGGCGFTINADQLSTGGEMASFVEKVFFEKDMDSDGDGVMDTLDRCPGTPKGVHVDMDGCPIKTATPKDSDGDGVYDQFDRCPNTPRGTVVNRVGCPQKIIESASLLVEFDFDKADIRPAYHANLKRFADFLKKHPEATAEIDGHTDNFGSEKYNTGLSMKRSKNVRQFLIEKHGVNPAQLKTKGYGYTKPKTTNKTDDGRQKNRRAEAILTVNAN